MTAPTKADPLYERMVHAFGEKTIREIFRNMTIWPLGGNFLDLLTDEARDALLRRCISHHTRTRKFAAESRRHHREKQNVV